MTAIDLRRQVKYGPTFSLLKEAGGTGRVDGYAPGLWFPAAARSDNDPILRGQVVKSIGGTGPSFACTPITAVTDVPVGVALEDIAENSVSGAIAFAGVPVLILTTGTIAVGDRLYTSGTTGRATATYAAGAHVVGISLNATSGTSSVWAIISLLGSRISATNPDHGLLTGLTNDHHPQYALEAELAWKQPVRAATTAAGTLASSFENGDTIDGVVLATGDRILIKDQAAGAENGIYTVNASGAPTRATDFDLGTEAVGAAVIVTNGTANADKVFICTTNAPITIGTTALVFAALSAAATLIIQEDDVDVDTAVATLDFRTALSVTSSPAGEANVSVDLGTGSGQAAAGDHTHAGGDSSKASATSDLAATTTTAADVTGASLSLAAGTYIVIGVFDVSIKTNTDRLFEGILDVGGTDENDLATLQAVGLDTDDRGQVTQVWRVVLGSTTTVKLQARHSGGAAGDFAVNAANTTLTAFVAGGRGPRELDYVQITSNVSPTATTEGTANTVVTASAVSFDGATPVLIEFFSPRARPDDAANGRELHFWLYQDGSSIGRIGQVVAGQGGGPATMPIKLERRMTPASGSRTYSIRASVNAGTGVIVAGAGGSGADMPAFIRISEVM